MENQRKSEENEMQLSRMQAAGCRTNGTVAAGYCAIRNPLPISQCEFRNAKFTLRNFAMRISQCQFRNANFNFAMPNSNSQCQYTVHLSHNQSHCEISHCEIHNPLCENSQTHFALRNSPCEIYRPCHPL